MKKKEECPTILEMIRNPDLVSIETAKQSGGRALGATLFDHMMETICKSKGDPNKSWVERIAAGTKIKH